MRIQKTVTYISMMFVWCMFGETRPDATWQYHYFDEAMKTQQFPQALETTKRIIGIHGIDVLALMRQLYERNNPSAFVLDAAPRIPKIIHQIWLGSPLPEEFKPFMRTWLAHHGQGWEYKLWTDDDVAELVLYNQQFYDATDNYGVKSDILKWEIIYRYGGVYVDVDFECLQPLDVFHHTCDFYTGIQPLDTQFVQLGAALFGAIPGHPILRHCIETIKDDWHHRGAPTKTGPVHFTKSFFATAGKEGLRDVALPAFYFYPLGCLEKKLMRELWIEQGAYAVHHWAKSWMPAHFRSTMFKNINNHTSTESWND